MDKDARINDGIMTATARPRTDAPAAGGMRPEEYVLPRWGVRRWALVVAVGVAGAAALSVALERYIDEATRRTPRPPRLVPAAAATAAK